MAYLIIHSVQNCLEIMRETVCFKMIQLLKVNHAVNRIALQVKRLFKLEKVADGGPYRAPHGRERRVSEIHPLSPLTLTFPRDTL